MIKIEAKQMIESYTEREGVGVNISTEGSEHEIAGEVFAIIKALQENFTQAFIASLMTIALKGSEEDD